MISTAVAKTTVADIRPTCAADLAAEQLASLPAPSVVAACGGSVTTSREPPGERTKADDAPGESAATAPFVRVNMAIRIPELAKWIAARPSFTFAEAGAASAPSPCSPTVMAYTLPDTRLTSALADLGYEITAGGKNGYTVTAIKAPVQQQTSHARHAAKTTTSAAG